MYGATLQTYFRSGWAFLIPYLFVYLLYALLRWPVNPVTAGSMEHGARSWVPCLLHVFWFLHGLHLILCAIAIQDWMRQSSLFHSRYCILQKATPWILIGLVIWIPGLYLEFPSDPIAHLGRILEWSQVAQVAETSRWLKASYFFAYSIAALGQTESYELFLRLYYTVMCLLLSWQNYRLALEMKIGSAAAFFFAAMQLVVFGNGGFSYHRYYGLSSSIVSQLATVALLRIALQQLTEPKRSFSGAIAASLALLLLVVFNHIQGLLIIAVGLASLGLWWLSCHHRTALIAVGLGVTAGSLALLAKGFLAPSSSLITLREAGWLNTAGAFDLFGANSLARHRMLELIGIFGLGSCLLGLFMFRRNNPGAWLLTVPLVFLFLPVTSYPLALYLFGDGPGFLLSFHGRGLDHLSVFSRLLFAMPLALPIAWLFSELLSHPRWCRYAILVPLVAIWMLLALPTSVYSHARLWQALARAPADLELKAVRQSISQIRAITEFAGEKKIIGGNGISYLIKQMGAKAVSYSRRLIHYPEYAPPAQDQQVIGEYMRNYWPMREFLVVLPAPSLFFSPGSQAAQLSRHWLPQEAAFNTVGGNELAWMSRDADFRTIHLRSGLSLMTNAPPTPQPPPHEH